ncbi:hypothetical protein QVD17_28425 [Tagetes erecta]|uniref:Uncharacterized protein n=1 Tax=Tagetes erecta TaxID=13708 RepID=A0AAD8KDT2_TARER|nr:hypothetical protein QVD17_28425 [Tagetes erecta]
MVSTINAQVIVERHVEAALVEDGLSPQAFADGYRDIQGALHYPQGRLLSVRTYTSYVSACLKRIQFLKSGPIVEGPLLFRLSPVFKSSIRFPLGYSARGVSTARCEAISY